MLTLPNAPAINIKVLLTFMLVPLIASEFAPRVKTPWGVIQGYCKTHPNYSSYAAFEGIRYAHPPIGELRFEPPKLLNISVKNVVSAKELRAPCLQYLAIPIDIKERIIGEEDCLFLNIYVPNCNETKKYAYPRNLSDSRLPVLFWIHGGAFQYGSGIIDGSRIVDRNVIFVSFNYRVGALGFLSTEDEIVPGNMGLKDQNLALRWISQNIQYFGGDKKRITIAGNSAGAASVHYHYLSPMSRGLFQAGLSASGTTLNCWAQTEDSLKKTIKLSILLNCPTQNSTTMIECLKEVPGKEIVKRLHSFMPWFFNPLVPFGPVVEKSGHSPFINDTPIHIMQRGDIQDIPWLATTTSEEGLFPTAAFISHVTRTEELNKTWPILAPYLLDYNFTVPKERFLATAQSIKEKYLEKWSINDSDPMIEMVSDRLFKYDFEKAVKLQARVNKSPVYTYVFNYRGAHSMSDIFTNTNVNFGVSHGDDVYYVLNDSNIVTSETAMDRQMQEEMTDIWTSFITGEIPRFHVPLPPVNPQMSQFSNLYINGPKNFTIKSEINFGHHQFWESLNFNENVPKR